MSGIVTYKQDSSVNANILLTIVHVYTGISIEGVVDTDTQEVNTDLPKKNMLALVKSSIKCRYSHS